jgi:hypothetical protein
MIIMKIKAILFFTFLFVLTNTHGQSIWNKSQLEEVKRSIDQAEYAPAYKALLVNAEHDLQQPTPSVMRKSKTPASGNKHDYMSQARYFWPDPSKPDGLPYITRDGESNPELELLDRNRLGEMAERVTTLSLAWYFSGEEKYAQKATDLIRVWFFNKATKMNPNLNYAQMVPGLNGGKGRCYGVIDTYSFVEMLDAVQLLEQSNAFTAKDSKQLKDWFKQLLNWILTSEQGKEEARQANNHSIAYDVQAIAFALYADQKDVAINILNEFPGKRIFKQIAPDGKQPHELRRTIAFHYSLYNLQHIIDISLMGQKLGINIDNATSADGRSLYKALDFLASYLGKNLSDWKPYQELGDEQHFQDKQQELIKEIYRAYILNPSQKDYLKIYLKNRILNLQDRFNLLYVKADEVDNAFAFAQQQLTYALDCVAKTKEVNTNKKLISPRTVEKDGSLRLVAPRDWCSGFFPGELWQMYQFSHNPTQREIADAATWPIEEMKNYTGTHDLGFVIYNSFGQAYRATDDTVYRNVALTAANTLSKRYSPKVKAIRSWDWNRDKWQYPVIIDNMINLEMLFWATQETGDSIYYNMAVNHATTTMNNHFRDDNSSYHVVNYDSITGTPLTKITHQGLFDESVWSRGQAWGLYGFTMCYRFTHNPDFLAMAEKIATFYFNQPNLPEDLIPYWDMKDPAIPQSPRDASAAAVIASALYELADYTSAENRTKYIGWADTIVHNLSMRYQAKIGTEQGFLLLHSTGNYPSHDEIDMPISYADYYYLEALSRKLYR